MAWQMELKNRDTKGIKFVFVGDGKLRPHLIKRVEDEKLENCIFIDPVPRTELAELIQEADAGMMILDNIPAFYYGTSPNKFFDYISLGLPVLNNYPGWLARMIERNKCGIAVSPACPNTFADALIELSEDKETRLEMGRHARQLAEREFDRDQLATKFVDYLERLLSP